MNDNATAIVERDRDSQSWTAWFIDSRQVGFGGATDVEAATRLALFSPPRDERIAIEVRDGWE